MHAAVMLSHFVAFVRNESHACWWCKEFCLFHHLSCSIPLLLFVCAVPLVFRFASARIVLLMPQTLCYFNQRCRTDKPPRFGIVFGIIGAHFYGQYSKSLFISLLQWIAHFFSRYEFEEYPFSVHICSIISSRISNKSYIAMFCTLFRLEIHL